MSTSKEPIALYHLSGSRSIRIAWLLEELHLPYTVIETPRTPIGAASAEMKAHTGGLGRVPTIRDGDVVVQESGAIVEYLIETYPPPSSTPPLMPPLSSPALRARVREYVHMAEGTFFMRVWPIFIGRRVMRIVDPPVSAASLAAYEDKLRGLLVADLNWLEGELAAQKRRIGGGSSSGVFFLVGDNLTAADIMMVFSVWLIMERSGVKGSGKAWPVVEEWLQRMMETRGWTQAVEKMKFEL